MNRIITWSLRTNMFAPSPSTFRLARERCAIGIRTSTCSSSPGEQRSSARRERKSRKKLNYVAGECELSKAGLVHVVENLSETAFRNVVVELKPRAEELRRGVEPVLLAGEAAIERILRENLAEAIIIDLSPGGEVEIAGPAVLAAPYAPVMVKELDEYNIPLGDFRKLMWVCAPRKVGVRNEAAKPTKVVLVQVGRSL